MSSPRRNAIALHELPRLGQASLLVLVAGLAAGCLRLWPEWRHNPDLSHGFFMPIVFGLLLHESRQNADRFFHAGTRSRLLFVTALALGIVALFAAGLYAASVDWSHALVGCALMASIAFFLTAAWVVLADDRVRFVGLNWSALVAIGLWLLCTPIPPGTYTRLTLTLQLWISEAVLRALHVLGVAAIRHGNIIELARTTVGVEEACSGVRSLISCLFAGLFFSATLVRKPWARAFIIALAAPLALLMNFIRSLALTLLSNNGVDISGTWHDLTGFAVLGVTAVILAVVAVLLERASGEQAPREIPAASGRPPTASFLVLIATLGVAAALVFVCVANTRPSARADGPVPDIERLLPETAPGWQVKTSDDLYQFRDTLQTDHLAQRTYRRVNPDGSVTELILYAAFWHAGQAPVSLVASHTPDACWPGSGWSVQPVPQPRVQLTVGGRQLPAAEYRMFTFNTFPQYVWFWHIYDGQPLTYRDPYSAVELLRIAWKYGFRHDGDQLFLRVSSNRPWAELANDPIIADFFSRTKPYGL